MRRIQRERFTPAAAEEIPAAKAGTVVPLFNTPANPSAELRQKQYEIQRAMLNEALAKAPAPSLTDLYKAKVRPKCDNPVRNEQAAKQENRGNIFSSAFAHIRHTFS